MTKVQTSHLIMTYSFPQNMFRDLTLIYNGFFSCVIDKDYQHLLLRFEGQSWHCK